MKLKMLVMDVDGTLTDGIIYISGQGEVMKAFDVKDGYAIKHILPTLGITPVIITGRKSDIVERRSKELDICELYQGVLDKVAVLKEIAEKHSIKPEEIAYIGDDLNDLPAIEFCGLTACPQNSVAAVMKQADYICRRDGGRGAVREFIDFIYEKESCSFQRPEDKYGTK